MGELNIRRRKRRSKYHPRPELEAEAIESTILRHFHLGPKHLQHGAVEGVYVQLARCCAARGASQARVSKFATYGPAEQGSGRGNLWLGFPDFTFSAASIGLFFTGE